jgi:hypothetical protein
MKSEKSFFRLSRSQWISVAVLGSSLGLAVAAVTIPNSFTAGTTISATQVNDNFLTLGNAMPAISQTAASGSVPIPDATVVNVRTITFTAPANGFVVVTGQGNVEIDQTVVGSVGVQLYLTTVSGGTSASDKVWAGFSNAGGTTQFFWLAPFSLTRIYPVTGGTSYTYFLTADEPFTDASANGFVQNATLTAMFVPSAL